MDWFISFILYGLLVQISVAPPVTKDKANEENKGPENLDMEVMEYHRYLREVVEALESDPEFRAKLENAGQSDIYSGKIANELEFVNHKVRTTLDELKRAELERLRHLAIKENQLNNGLDLKHLKIAQHIDHSNTHSFEIDDLKKLIAKTTEDLVEADRRRREQFKKYEMQKKFEQEQKMKAMNEEEKKKYVQQLEEMREKHKKHEPLHHPGSKQQLEEVWEKQDHMDSQDFDLQKFFYFHDIDGNGVWDQNEVKALFLKDLDKLYADGAPEDDLVEREEEMERMREHVFNEADLNKDGLISYQEFLEQTKKPNFQQDPGWEALDEQQIYSQEEYEAFERLRRKEMQGSNANKIQPPYESNVAAHNQQFQPQHGSPSGHPQAGDNSIPQQQYQYQGQPIQQQYHPQQVQVPQQHYQGQVPIQQQEQQPHYNQIPQQQYQGQVMPQDGQFHGQVQSNQIPVQHQQQQQQQQPQQQQQQQQYQTQQQPQHPNVQVQIPQKQQQQNVPNQIPQQQNTLNQIPQQLTIQNQTPENNQNHVVQQNQQPIQNSAQHIQQNSIHSAGKV